MSDFVSEHLMEEIRKVLKLSQTERCSIVSMRGGNDPLYINFHASATGEIEENNNVGEVMFRTGSLVKLLLAISLHLILEKLPKSSNPDDKKYHSPHRWDERFTVAFNSHRKGKRPMKPLRGNPTIRNLLTHTNGLPNVNHFILAPDQTSLMSAEDFIAQAGKLSNDIDHKALRDQNWVQYSNGNYILIALLIEAVSGQSLGKFLKEKILGPLEMKLTCVDARELRPADEQSAEPPQRALPYMVYGEGQRKLIKERMNMSNAMELATLGIHSCAQDLQKLYAALFSALAGRPTYKLFDHRFASRLFGADSHSSPEFGEDSEYHVACGLAMKVESKSVGSQSMNALVTNEDESVRFTLGRAPFGKDLKTFWKQPKLFYQAGLTTGQSCCVYLIPLIDRALLVMTNTLGRIDSSDYISRLLLQEICYARTSSIPHVALRDRKVDVYEKSEKAAKETEKSWKRLDVPSLPAEGCLIPHEKLTGRYLDKSRLQSIEIEKDENGLSVKICVGSMSSTRMNLVQISQSKFQIHPLEPAIDVFDAWENLTLEIEESHNAERIMCISRKVLKMAGTKELLYTYRLEEC